MAAHIIQELDHAEGRALNWRDLCTKLVLIERDIVCLSCCFLVKHDLFLGLKHLDSVMDSLWEPSRVSQEILVSDNFGDELGLFNEVINVEFLHTADDHMSDN